MTLYTTLKRLRVVSAALLFGTGLGSAFCLFLASRTRDPSHVAFVARNVLIADGVFTAAPAVVQPVSGVAMALVAGLPLASRSILGSLAPYALAGACWLPAVWLQLRMRDIARRAATEGDALPPRFGRCFRVSAALGVPAFAALLIVFWLMIAKPA